jgi:hypothetical protein
MRFEQGGIAFEVPRHWEDRSIVAFAAPKAPGQEQSSNLVMTRDQLLDGESLGDYADRQLGELAHRVDDFVLTDRFDKEIDGHQAVELRFASRGKNGPVMQRMVIAATPKREILCFTATAPSADIAQMGPLFDRILASIRLPATDGATRPDESGASAESAT